MTTADHALIVSLFSAIVALASFGWNVWSKFMYPKARLRLSFYTCQLVSKGQDARPRYVALDATNFGPTEVTVVSVHAVMSAGLFREPERMIVNAIADQFDPGYAGAQLDGVLPKTLKIGEKHSAYFPFDAQSFGRDELVKVGFSDNFDRMHWCSKRHIKNVRRELDQRFAGEPYDPAHRQDRNFVE